MLAYFSSVMQKVISAALNYVISRYFLNIHHHYQGLRLYLLYTSTSTSTSPYKLDKYRCLQVQATQALWACFIQVQVAKTVVQSLYKFFWPTSTVTELVHKLHKLCTSQMIQYNRFQLFIQRVLLGSFLWRTGHLTDNQRLFLLFKWIKDTPDKSQNTF